MTIVASHADSRWNYRTLADGSVECCQGLHDASDPCEWEPYMRAPEVLPQGVKWNDADLLDAYATGLNDAQPGLDPAHVARAADAYVKLAHLKRLDP